MIMIQDHGFGTSLMLSAVDMQAELWSSELKIITMQEKGKKGKKEKEKEKGKGKGKGKEGKKEKGKEQPVGVLSRRLEIFLDYLLALSVDEAQFLVSKRFESRPLFRHLPFFLRVSTSPKTGLMECLPKKMK